MVEVKEEREKRKERKKVRRKKVKERRKKEKNDRSEQDSRRIEDLRWGRRSSKVWRRGQEIGFLNIS